MYSCCFTMSHDSLKNAFEKVVFQILAKIKMTRNKNRLFGGHFETVQFFLIIFLFIYLFVFFFFICIFFFFFFFCCRIMILYSAYIYVQISSQYSAGKVVFYGWVTRTPPPWAPTGVKVPWSLKC